MKGGIIIIITGMFWLWMGAYIASSIPLFTHYDRWYLVPLVFTFVVSCIALWLSSAFLIIEKLLE